MMQTIEDDRLSIVDLMQELRRRYGQVPAYNTVWHAIACGEIPAERVRGRWRVKRADVAQVAAVVGIAAAA